MHTQLIVAEYNRSREMYSPVRRNTRKQQYPSAFDKNGLLRVQEDRQTTKEEGSKEENRREGAKCENMFQILLVSPLLCFLLLLLSIYLLLPEEDNFCRSCSYIIVSLCFVALVSTFPQICSILSASSLVFHSFVAIVAKFNIGYLTLAMPAPFHKLSVLCLQCLLCNKEQVQTDKQLRPRKNRMGTVCSIT